MALHGKTHGMRYSREYAIWETMKKRCLKPNMPSYKYYGAKGVTVCDKWMKFEGFFEDMGLSNGLCIDRIDNKKGYSKDNCRWVTYKENNRNKSNNVVVDGKTVSEWSEKTGISKQVISHRIKKMGMSPIAAVTTPIMRGRNKVKEEA
jgi:hypothetical protein